MSTRRLLLALAMTLWAGMCPPAPQGAGVIAGDGAEAIRGFLPAVMTGIPARADGAQPLSRPPAGVSDQNPAFSPDGRFLVFTRFENGYNSGPAGVFRLDLSSGKAIRLTPEEDQDHVNLPGSAWNPVRNRIVFASDRSDRGDLWRIAPDGSDLTPVTDHDGPPWYIEPSWSPDGEWIVFEAGNGVPDDRQRGSIWKVRADGTRLTVLTDGPAEGVDDRQPNWSPAGDRILFQRRGPDSDDWDIYTMAPDGTDVRRVTDRSSSDTDASWSPDGRYIVYSSDYGGLPTSSIFVVPAEGGTPARVTFSDAYEDGAPSWSPDGRWIAFESRLGEGGDSPASLWRVPAPAATAFTWPEWAYEARLAGVSFEPDMSDAEIEARLQRAVEDGVSVLVVDAPTGWSYTAWVDDVAFNRVLTLMRDRVFPRAHAKGLKVVWYLAGLELVCEGCAQTGRDPATEHPQWMQIDRSGDPVQFSGVQGIFWLGPDDLDAWLSPESPYRDFYIGRIEEIASAGADGLWMDVAYLLNGIGQFDDLWPSYDPYSQAAFRAAYGYADIPAKDWGDPTWRRFVRWRQISIARFIRDVAAAAQRRVPGLLFFTENWGIDSNFVTQYAQDSLDFITTPFVATAHELEPVDQGDAGMANATLKQWRDYVLMVKFAAAVNKGRPAWVLTYAGGVDDSLREGGVHLAEGANFYEAKGPEMMDDSTGSRPVLFPWLAANARLAYHSSSMAEVAVWYSPRTRDFIDGENAGDSKFDYAAATYLSAYRGLGRDLLKAQIPFDIVTGQWSLAELRRYAWLVLPNAVCMSAGEAALLRDYVAVGGKLAVTGDTGERDAWCRPRPGNALTGVPTHSLHAVSSDLLRTDLANADRGRVLIEPRRGEDERGPFLLLTLVNFDSGRDVMDINVDLRLPGAFSPTSVVWNAPDAAGGDLPFTIGAGRVRLTLPVLHTAAAIILRDAALRPTGSFGYRPGFPPSPRSGAMPLHAQEE